MKDKKDLDHIPNEITEKDFLKKTMGVFDKTLYEEIFLKAAGAMPCTMQSEKQIQVIGMSMHEMQPKDPIEAKLCAKEAVLYSLLMQYAKRAETGMFSEDSTMISRVMFETNMNFTIKLMRLHNETVETLNRYKRGGEQKVIVQHQYGVQVNEGGQAVVSNQLNLGNEGGKKEFEEEPHGSKEILRSEIENQQSSTMPFKSDAKRKVPISRRKKHRAD